MQAEITMAQFTAGATARRTLLQLGFVPDAAIVFAAHTATNPNILFWFNKGGQTLPANMQVPDGADSFGTLAPSVLSQWLDADDHLLLTGSTGVVTRVTTGIAAYFGGEEITADESISSNPQHPYSDGTFPKSGARTMAGLELPAAILTNDALYIVIAFRRAQDAKVAALTS